MVLQHETIGYRSYHIIGLFIGIIFILTGVLCRQCVQSILVSIGSSIIASVITAFIFYEIEHKRDEKFIEHLNIIENIAAERMFIMCETDRKKLLGTGYYDRVYNRATDIGIYGNNLCTVIRYICDIPKIGHNDHWVKQLFSNKRRQDVHVNLIIPYPNMHSPSSSIESINILKAKAGASNKANKLSRGNYIRVYLTKVPILFSISYSSSITDKDNDEMLFALLVDNRDRGPIYKIKRTSNSNVYEELQRYVDSLTTQNSILIFQWDDKGIKYMDYENAIS